MKGGLGQSRLCYATGGNEGQEINRKNTVANCQFPSLQLTTSPLAAPRLAWGRSGGGSTPDWRDPPAGILWASHPQTGPPGKAPNPRASGTSPKLQTLN